MKTGLFITARLGSSRLERKHLLPVGETVILQKLIDRINGGFAAEIARGEVEVVVVTGSRKSNQTLGESVRQCSVFYGDDDNIPLRHLQAARGRGLDAIVSVDGDDVLCSLAAMRAVWARLGDGCEYVRTKGLPLGLNAHGYSVAFLQACLSGADQKVLETGWGRIFDQARVTEIALPSRNERYLRFTLDYEEDYRFFKRIFERLGDAVLGISDEALVAFVLENGIYKLNEAIAEEYWENFHRGVQKEKTRERTGE
jgi:spore coat polysaccharide biosynthesis protein SpsF (cytidylyltransferase family)